MLLYMTDFSCFICKRSTDNEFIDMHACYVCRHMICIDCKHEHELFTDDKSLKHIVESKQKLFVLSCDIISNFDNKNTIEYMIENRIGYNQLHTNKKSYFITGWNERASYDKFIKGLVNIKERFLYEIILMILQERLCNDIVESICRYL